MTNNHSDQSTALPEVLTRGVEQIVPEAADLARLMQERKIRVYLGIDPTAAFLTLGHSVVLRKLQQFALLGHDVILLIGNGTVRIGDPTGRDTTRPILTDEQIEANFQDWQKQASKILDFSNITIKHNGDWLDKLTFADIVKLLAKTTVQQLTERDMFQERIKNKLPIHGHEIIYPLLQGYDSVAMDVDLEIGGSDQLFNMLMGRELQRSYNNRNKWVLTTPIINGTDGRKMSKSYGNFIALTEPANDMYGKLMSVADNEIISYFTILTDVPLAQIEDMKKALAAGENPMVFKKQLAREITTMYHSPAAASEAQQHFEKTVQQRQVPDDIPTVSVDQARMPLIEACKQCLPNESTSELKRLIQQGGVELQPGGVVSNPQTEIQIENTLIRIGKRRYFRFILSS